jgi:hypothetical protein
MTQSRSTRAILILPFLLALTATAATAQIVVARPAIEAGFRAAAVAAPSTSGFGGGPHVTWNLNPRTSVEVSADFRSSDDNGFTTARQTLGFVQLKRSVHESPGGRLFLTLGGLAGSERRATSPLVFIRVNSGVVPAPQTVSHRGIGGFSIGAGYDRALSSHLSFSAETQLLVMDRVGVRALVGFSTPLGAYRLRRETAAPSNAKLSGVHTGDTAWVTMSDGTMWKGRVAGISTTQIELAQAGVVTPLSIERVRKIETTDRITDGLKRGVIVGALSGIPVTFAVISTCGSDDECTYYAGLFGVVWSGVGAGVGSVIGALADSLHEGRRTVYESGASVRLTPIVGLHKAGIGGAIRW